ncbi:DUF934 domain-containing protein [Fontimonas sp. SYSU GA230001]|uniref:DUF934 domain-containing protein n=1 Tax=Fontimonas sp. SYSU GA230001 TaxID=3142450 RepID=UPI0032B5D0C3
MSTLIRDNAAATDDFVALADDQPLPASGKIIVPLARWLELDRTAVTATVGVSVPNTVDIDAVWPALAGRPLIELNFPAFGDGRAYSQARVLRDRCGYAGELRARGAAVVVDQAAQLARCGFNAYVLRADQNAEAFLARLQRTAGTAWYQHPSQRPLPASARQA